MKKLLILTILLLGINICTLKAQQSYSIIFGENVAQGAFSAIKTSKGDVLLTGMDCEVVSLRATHRGKIWKISPNGDTLVRTYNLSDTAMSFGSIFEQANGDFLVFGSTNLPPYDITSHTGMILRLNSNLDIIGKKFFYNNGTANMRIGVTKKIGDKYCCYISISKSDYTHDQGFMLLDENLNFIKSRLFEPEIDIDSFDDFVINQELSQIWCVASINFKGYNIIKFDDQLNVIQMKNIHRNSLPDSNLFCDLSHSANIRLFENNSALIISNQYIMNNLFTYTDKGIGVQLIDGSMNINPIKIFGKPDREDFVTGNSIDFVNYDTIFFTGIESHEKPFHGVGPNNIIVGMLNKDLQPIAISYYGGDMLYQPNIIKCIDDNSILIVARVFKPYETSENCKIMVLNLTRDNIISNQILKDDIIQGNINSNICSIFPNPVSDKMYIDLKVDKGTVRISSIVGQLLFTKDVIQGRQPIDLSNLSNGVYIVNVTSPAGESYMQKIIKK